MPSTYLGIPLRRCINITMAHLNELALLELLYNSDSNLNLVYIRNISRDVVITRDVLVYYVNKEYLFLFWHWQVNTSK